MGIYKHGVTPSSVFAEARTKPPAITNVHVDAVSCDGRKAAAGFTFRDRRFHVWFDPSTMKLDDDVLHSNPLVEPPREDRRNHHRSLDATAAKNAPLLAAMWKEIEEKNLVALALQAEKDKRAREEAEQQVAIRENLKRAAGPALYDGLAKAVEFFDENGGDESYSWLPEMKAALKLAREGAK